MKKILLSLVLVIYLSLKADAQQISGKVLDASGQASPGVNVVVNGTTRGTSTDAEGKFSIEAKERDILIVSHVGYKSTEAPVEIKKVSYKIYINRRRSSGIFANTRNRILYCKKEIYSRFSYRS